MGRVTLYILAWPDRYFGAGRQLSFAAHFGAIIIRLAYSSIDIASQGRIQGAGLWGLETLPPEIYQRSQKSDVLV